MEKAVSFNFYHKSNISALLLVSGFCAAAIAINVSESMYSGTQNDNLNVKV